jgi:hypothetical protein
MSIDSDYQRQETHDPDLLDENDTHDGLTPPSEQDPAAADEPDETEEADEEEQDDEFALQEDSATQLPEPEPELIAVEPEHEDDIAIFDPAAEAARLDPRPDFDSALDADPDAALDAGLPTVDESELDPIGNETVTASVDDATAGTVIAPDQSSAFLTRLHEIQVSFIDDPSQAAEDAGRLVAEVSQEFTAGLDERLRRLTSLTEQGTAAGTEDLRQAMRQYRALVDSLLGS